MFCQHCGAELLSEFSYCPRCGQKIANAKSEEKRSSPLWFRIFIAAVFLAAVIAIFIMLSSEDVTDTVEDQLKALRQDRITEAYYQFTSKSFQENTTLEHFSDFIKSYPFFTQNRSVRFIDRNVHNNQGTLEAILTPTSGSDKQVQYRLIKEDGRWKILNIRLENASKNNDHRG